MTLLCPDKVVLEPEQILLMQEQAEADGYRAGMEAAQAEAATAAERARAQIRSALDALASATAQAAVALRSEQKRLEAAAVNLSFDIAEAILAREVALAVDPGRDAAVRALAELPANGPATLRLHPDDVAAMGGIDMFGAETKVVPDPSIGRGGCMLDVGAAMVDARIETALQRVRQILDDATAEQ
jgi:flagellar assembly protein FliH